MPVLLLLLLLSIRVMDVSVRCDSPEAPDAFDARSVFPVPSARDGVWKPGTCELRLRIST